MAAALGKRALHGRDHLDHAGPADPARRGGRGGQAVRADVRPLRGAGAAHLLQGRRTADVQDRRAADGASHLRDEHRGPAGEVRPGGEAAQSQRRARHPRRDHRQGPRGGRRGHPRPDGHGLRPGGVRRGGVPGDLRDVPPAAGRGARLRRGVTPGKISRNGWLRSTP
ncbi:hypothetical protein SGPA1_11707 [Streptomyces misionensis JCM 4497]